MGGKWGLSASRVLVKAAWLVVELLLLPLLLALSRVVEHVAACAA